MQPSLRWSHVTSLYHSAAPASLRSPFCLARGRTPPSNPFGFRPPAAGEHIWCGSVARLLVFSLASAAVHDSDRRRYFSSRRLALFSYSGLGGCRAGLRHPPALFAWHPYSGAIRLFACSFFGPEFILWPPSSRSSSSLQSLFMSSTEDVPNQVEPTLAAVLTGVRSEYALAS